MDSLSSAPLLVAPVYFWQPNFYFLATNMKPRTMDSVWLLLWTGNHGGGP